MKNQSTQVPAEQSWFDTIKIKFQNTLSGMNLSFENISYGMLSVVIGFIAGFFFKKFGRPLFMLLLGILIIMGLLHYFGFVTVHWNILVTKLGFAENVDFSTIMQAIWQWVKSHILYVVCGTIGFLVGYKVA